MGALKLARVGDSGCAIEPAPAWPQPPVACGEPDAAAPAAARGFGIVRNRPLIDGSQRTVLVAVESFPALNGPGLRAPHAERALAMPGVAAGARAQDRFAARKSAMPRVKERGIRREPSKALCVTWA